MFGLLACEAQAESATMHLRLIRQYGDAGIDGLRVRACPTPGEGDDSGRETETRDGGFAELRIARSAGSASCLTIDGRANRPRQVVHYSSPFIDGQQEVLRLTDDALSRSIETRISAPIVETRAVIEARAYDGSRRPAAAWRLEVWNAGADGYRRCSDCRVWYPDDTGAPDPTLTQFSSSSDSPAWTVLTPRAAMFIVRDVKTQRPLSVLGPVDVRAGSVRLVFTSASALPTNL